MANNTIGWGQGATNNNIGWGRGSTNDIGWGNVYASSYVGDTDIQGADARFIISVKTDNAGTSTSTQFTLPWIGTYDVEWGDGTSDVGVTDTQTHTYASAGTYDVAVTATSGRIWFNNGGDKAKLVDIKNWGDVAWTSMQGAFLGCSNTVVSAQDALVLPADCRNMFESCSSLTTLDVSSWNMSSVTNTNYMFQFCSSLTALVVSSWDMSSVTAMNNMFRDCSSLTALDFSSWNTSSATDMGAMLRGCSSLKSDLSGLDIASVTNFTNFALGTNINASGTTTNYDNTLIAWEAQLQADYPSGAGYTATININFGGSQYTLGGAAATARASLISTFGWTITDGGGI